MYSFLSRSLSSRNCYISILIKFSERHVTYQVLPSGEKVVVNTKNAVRTEREEWQNVRPMGGEPELREIKQIELDERLESDPKAARNTASRKLQSLKDKLSQRGFCRETKSYDPPQNAQNLIQNICSEVFENIGPNQEWANTPLSDPYLKYKLLTKCSKEFNYEIPNSMLYSMKRVSDVYKFYSTPVRGTISYDQMVQNSDQLPKNVHVIGEPIRYNPENDEFFGGVNAYPFSALKVTGLRAKKKYPNFKSNFQWPDI